MSKAYWASMPDEVIDELVKEQKQMNPDDQQAANEVLNAMTGEKKTQYTDGAIMFSFINGSPGMALRANTPEEMERVMMGAAPLFRKFRAQAEEGSKNQAVEAAKTYVQGVQTQTTAQITNCPKCGGEMWDNRPKKASGQFKANSPDFKCKNNECGGVIWPPRN